MPERGWGDKRGGGSEGEREEKGRREVRGGEDEVLKVKLLVARKQSARGWDGGGPTLGASDKFTLVSKNCPLEHFLPSNSPLTPKGSL